MDSGEAVAIDMPTRNICSFFGETPIPEEITDGLPKRIPIMIQRTIKESDIYDIPTVPIIFVLGPEKSEIVANFDRLTEISGRLHHVDMTAIFLEMANIIESQDPNMIPPPKALEVFISKISSEIENADAMLVTGYPRSMRDVVEYMARVQRIDGVIFLDPSFQEAETEDCIETETTKYNGANSNYHVNISPITDFFQQEEKLYVITLDRPILEIYHDIYDKVMLILSRRIQSAPSSLMMLTEEEVTCIASSQSSPTKTEYVNVNTNLESQSKSKKSLAPKPNVLNKDVEDALSVVRAGSIMKRIQSGKN